MNSSDRLEEILRHLQLSPNKLSIELGLKNNVKVYHIKNGRNEISSGMAKLISDKFPELNYNWLLTGEGQMLKSESSINPNKTTMESKTLIDELKDRISSLEKQLNEKQQFCTFLMKQNDELQQLVTGIPEIKKKEAVLKIVSMSLSASKITNTG